MKTKQPIPTSQEATHCCALRRSLVEEIIAVLWTILWVLLWSNHAHPVALWIVGIKAAADHLCAILYAGREFRKQNAKSAGTDASAPKL